MIKFYYSHQKTMGHSCTEYSSSSKPESTYLTMSLGTWYSGHVS